MGYLNHYLCICCIVNAEEENRFALLNKAVVMFRMLNWLAFTMAGGDDKFEERNTCRSQTNEPWISIADTFGRWWGSLPRSMISQGVMIFWTRKVELKVMLADERGQNLVVDWWMKNNLLGCVEIFFGWTSCLLVIWMRNKDDVRHNTFAELENAAKARGRS